MVEINAGLPRKLFAEFVGTFFLVFAVGNIVAAGSPYFGILAIASTLMVMIYALGKISGAHFNPAVTFAVALVNDKFSAVDAVTYIVSQIAGAIAASFACLLLHGKASNVAPVAPYTWGEAVSVETIYTAFLVFCVLNTALASANANNEYYGLTIGFSVVAGGYASAMISGGYLNPAIALANDVASYKSGFGVSLLYAAFQFIGAGVAALLYRVVRPEEFGGTAKSQTACLVSEFIGTFILVLTAGLNILAPITTDKAPAVLSIASSLMCSIYALGSVSGAHFNPAVTLAVSLRQKMGANDALWYVVVQLAAGSLGGTAFGLIVNNGIPLGPQGSSTWWAIAIVEILFTFVLANVVLACASVSKPLSQFFGLAIGFCVIVGGYSAGAISGGVMNPAVSFGLGTSRAIWNGGNFIAALLYIVFQLIGGALAAGSFYITHPEEIGEETKPILP